MEWKVYPRPPLPSPADGEREPRGNRLNPAIVDVRESELHCLR